MRFLIILEQTEAGSQYRRGVGQAAMYVLAIDTMGLPHKSN